MISVKNLTKHYGDFSLNVSLEIPKGRITGLVGKNGAGKSTVIKSILGLIRPDGGSVQVFGKDAWELTPEEKQRIGAALSDSGFSNYLTVRDCAGILEKLYNHFDKVRSAGKQADSEILHRHEGEAAGAGGPEPQGEAADYGRTHGRHGCGGTG